MNSPSDKESAGPSGKKKYCHKIILLDYLVESRKVDGQKSHNLSFRCIGS